MFSKASQVRLLVMTFILSLLSCSLPLNEKQSKPSKPEAKLSFDSKCLKEIGTNLSEWAEGEGEDSKLQSTWVCLESAIDVFKTKVVGKGSPRDEYSPEEVASFFQGYVLKETKFDPPLMAEIMAIKVLLVGGSDKKITRGELDRFKALIQLLKEISIETKPFMKVYTTKWAPNAKSLSDSELQKFRQSSAILGAAGTRLSAFISKNEGSYDLNRLPVLFKELQKFSKTPWTWLPKLNQYIPLLVSVKGILFGDLKSELVSSVNKSQLPAFFSVAVQAYTSFLEYNYFISPAFGEGKLSDLSQGAGLRSLGRFVENGLALINVFPDARAEKVVPVEEIYELWLTAKKADLVPEKISDESIRNLLPVVFNRILLNPSVRQQGTVIAGLTRFATQYVAEEFGAWSAVQNFAAGFFQGNSIPRADPDLSQKGLAESWSQLVQCLTKAPDQIELCKFPIPDEARKAAASVAQPQELIRSAQEMQAMFTSKLSLSHRQGQRLQMGNEALPYTFESVSVINLSRTLTRILLHAYASRTGLPGKNIFELTSDDAKLAIKDLNPIAADLNFIEANSTSFATLRFFEANLFTPHGDGSDEVNARELTSLVLYILSGLAHHSTLDERIRNLHCKDQLQLDPAGDAKKDRVAIKCLVTAYKAELASTVADEATLPQALPQLSSYMLELAKRDLTGGSSTFESMLYNLMKASGWKDNGSGTVAMKEISLIVHVMQYIETVMQRFDAPQTGVKDGVLTRKEALAGYPIFRNIINVLLSKDGEVSAVLEIAGDRLSKASYAYVLYHGGIPSCSADKKELLKWAILPSAWKLIRADRSKLGEILGVLSEMTRKQENETIVGRCFYE